MKWQGAGGVNWPMYYGASWLSLDDNGVDSSFVCDFCRTKSANGAVRCESCGAPRIIPIRRADGKRPAEE